MAKNWGIPEAVFGGAKIHPVTHRYIENGSGALPESAQVRQHLADIEREQGKTVADRMREEIKFLEEATAKQEQHS
ncbi:hypothetical protein [Bradyrhizobium sp. dw_411]|uniref:hypothetical protein n=1 Tax=Bradyrhizobium sp. dw_411 TaxID=2720082 RepID=UPI001BCA8514|nr:hypothetical protein [Bradyrhizobium sp. dw_411]